MPADVPTAGPNLLSKGERPPVMPLLATTHTAAGAVSFAKFFELTIDWGYATTSTAYMRHYYESTCVTCKSIQIALENARAKGRHFVGGRMTVISARDRGPGGMRDADRSATVSYRLTSTAVIGADGSFVGGDRARTMEDRIFVRWISSGWSVAEMVPLK